MALDWHWQLHPEGTDLPGDVPADSRFPSQSEAETWLGETWRQMAAAGVEAVSLLEGDRVVYGPMSLSPG